MATFKALPRGAQLVLVAGPLLIISLFFTWQQVEVDYGPAGVAKMPLDGWDAWGLLLALLALTVVVLVALVDLSHVDLGEIPWRNAILALGIAVLAVAALKNLTDAGSTPASYAFVGLAALVAVGAYLDWAAARRADRPALARKRRGVSSAA